ncbi:hypothetical protein BG000_005511 [Podila horticola]|nr:hypothetical protein BG000_005511 [Podila horticola]
MLYPTSRLPIHNSKPLLSLPTPRYSLSSFSMQIKQVIIVSLVAAVATAQNIAWKGSAPFCNPQPCEKEDHGARPYELRRSPSGDGKPCITGHKKCCADADTELNQAACLYSDNGRHNPDSDDDDEDYIRFLMKKGFRVQHNQYEF